MCNYEIDRHLKEMSQTVGRVDGRTQRSDVQKGLWSLQYEFNITSFTIPTHFNPKLTRHICTQYIAQ